MTYKETTERGRAGKKSYYSPLRPNSAIVCDCSWLYSEIESTIKIN